MNPMQTTPTAVGESTDILAIANAPILWALALGVFVVIIIQSVIYIKAAKVAAPAAGISQRELNTAFKTGAIAAIGPSLAVVIVAIALLALFGTPATLVRIGLIGSVSYETGAANISAATVGSTLGGPEYTQNVFAVAFFAMSLGGAMWMIATLIMTPLLQRGEHKLQKINPAIMTVIPAAALLAAFISLGIAEVPKSAVHVITLLSSAVTMGICVFFAKQLKQDWLKEWGLGIAIVVGLVVAYASHFSAIGPAA
jgi:hypothetical protein